MVLIPKKLKTLIIHVSGNVLFALYIGYFACIFVVFVDNMLKNSENNCGNTSKKVYAIAIYHGNLLVI